MVGNRGGSELRKIFGRGLVVALAAVLTAGLAPVQSQETDWLVSGSASGRPGGALTVALRSEPKTLNPMFAVDGASREILFQLNASLIRINRASHETEASLARRWSVSPDGRRYTLELRKGLRFSDGEPFDADDVVFTFESILDERNGSPQRSLLIVGGEPVSVRKIAPYVVTLDLKEPYAAAERLFDGVPILPRHKLERFAKEGRLAEAWSIQTAPGEVAGLGPFRVKHYRGGDRIVLERNPHYWKLDEQGVRLPYLLQLTYLFVPNEDAQAVRFGAGETDLIERLNAPNFEALERQSGTRRMLDLGPGLRYSFLFFNLSDIESSRGDLRHRQSWFGETRFRQAVSKAIDRHSIARLVYRNRATALAGHVTPGNRRWINESLPRPVRSIEAARSALQSLGFHRTGTDNGALVDSTGHEMSFSILVSASNPARTEMPTIIQADLAQLGIEATIQPLETRAIVDRIFNTKNYEACILSLESGDADPNSEMNVWLSSGGTHLWNPGQGLPSTAWEARIDELMKLQLITLSQATRKSQYDEVQSIVARELPLIPLVSANVLVGAKTGLGGFRPGVLQPLTLWNAEELYWVSGKPAAR